MVVLPVGSEFTTYSDGLHVDYAGRVSVLLRRFLSDGHRELTRLDLGPDGDPESAKLTALWSAAGHLLVAFTDAGKVIAVTNRRDTPQVVARFTVDGNPDPTFGDGGFVEIPLAEVAALHPLSDGAILLAGGREGYIPTIAKLRPDGGLDATFGDQGLVPDRILGVRAGFVSDVATDSTGRILALVGRFPAPNFQPTVWVQAHHPNGTRDYSFGEEGTAGEFLGWPSYRLYVSNTGNVLMDASGRGLYRVQMNGRVFERPWGIATSTGGAIAFYPRNAFVAVGTTNEPDTRRVLNVAGFGPNGTEQFTVQVDAGSDFAETRGSGVALAPDQRITSSGAACKDESGCTHLVVVRVGGR